MISRVLSDFTAKSVFQLKKEFHNQRSSKAGDPGSAGERGGLPRWPCPMESLGPAFPCTPTSHPSHPTPTPADIDSDTASPWLLNSSLREILHKTTTHRRLAVGRSWEEWRATASGYELSLKGDENVTKLDYGCTTPKILKPILPLNGRMLWYVNYTSGKLLQTTITKTHKISIR